MLHVYGIIDSDHVAGAAPSGHEGDAVTAFAVADIAAAVSRAAHASIDASPDHVWRHETVLGALMARHAVLPMRFGTVCTDEDVACLLERRRDALRAALRQLAGKVEMAVRISDGTTQNPTNSPGPPPARRPASSGTAYLKARLAQHKNDGPALGGQTAAVRAYLAARSLDMDWRAPDAPGAPFKASCLIPREDVAGFAAGLERLMKPGLGLSCTGPWAPYSFVGKAARLGEGA